MRPAIKPQFNADLVATFIAQGKLTIVPPGNCVRPDDGEDWKTINENRYKIKLDKERAIE